MPSTGAVLADTYRSNLEGRYSTSNSHLKAPPPSYITSPQDPVAPSPISSDVTQFEDVDGVAAEEEDEGTEKGSLAGDLANTIVDSNPPASLSSRDYRNETPLKVQVAPAADHQLRNRLEEEPQSAIYIPSSFGTFPKDQDSSKLEQNSLPSPPNDSEDDTSGREMPEEQDSTTEPPGGKNESGNISTGSTQSEKDADNERSRSSSFDSLASTSTTKQDPVPEPMTIQDPKQEPTPRKEGPPRGKRVAAAPLAIKKSKARDAAIPPSPLRTTLSSLNLHAWSTTPRAQTRHDFAPLSRPGSSLASIDEGDDTDHPSTEDDSNVRLDFMHHAEIESAALRNALSECWTLCNTLASLSYIHRTRMFSFSGQGDAQEQAWKSCWKLCQTLYNNKDETLTGSYGHNSAKPTLDLCRDFCQALFEVRVRTNEAADSVLRVSFELNNHLFNTHDRSLPEAFRERTLDFYITLCHRLMKQKSKTGEETDSLLEACWSLAEMLFSLRQNRREGKRPDSELLGSAIQACWELCDLFREGWTQIRPERGTPRPSQTTFTQAFNQAKRSGFVPLDDDGNPKTIPETPTTIFEDTITTISPEEAPIPNIYVIGAEAALRMSSTATSNNAPASISNQRNLTPSAMRSINSLHSPHPVPPAPTSANPGHRWTSNASAPMSAVSMSAASDGGAIPTSATSVSTVRTPSDDPTLILLKGLFIKAAIATNRGYTRQSSDPNLNSLPMFTKSLPDTAFGTQAWQMSLLETYRKAVANDSGFRNLGIAGSMAIERGQLNPVDVARAVRGMTDCVYGFGWLRDLYRFVFGYYIEEALKGPSRQLQAEAAGRRAARHPAASLAATIMGSGNTGAIGAGSRGDVSAVSSVSGNGSMVGFGGAGNAGGVSAGVATNTVSAASSNASGNASTGVVGTGGGAGGSGPSATVVKNRRTVSQ
ncbi:hypothetical protein, variant [Exophiala mesophila]|uniref:DUF7624 domain-containing protein n=1 Tax=Exophiala mesophila TaxID=212818 RepID=A0A0D1ZM49_EXOME|nr:hypothetical protein, variant [Exophiala mesophila]KIV95737.1 hypothetical protein, variant [Exophiala mesophila]